MAKTMDPILPRLSILGYWAILMGSFGSPGGSTPDHHFENYRGLELHEDSFHPKLWGDPKKWIHLIELYNLHHRYV